MTIIYTRRGGGMLMGGGPVAVGPRGPRTDERKPDFKMAPSNLACGPCDPVTSRAQRGRRGVLEADLVLTLGGEAPIWLERPVYSQVVVDRQPANRPVRPALTEAGVMGHERLM